MAWQLALLTSFLLLVVDGARGLEVVIEYSFSLPEQFGVATPASAKCCPFGRLPNNDTGGMTPPTVFGIGTQKGGTSTLFYQFRAHPQLHGAEKELQYLDDGDGEGYQQYLRSWEWNRGQKSGDATNATSVVQKGPPDVGGLFEISPGYMAKVITPNAKFIVLLRDPTSRAYSGVMQSIKAYEFVKGEEHWRHRPFWNLMRQAIIELEAEPQCNFQTGKGVHTYNDCMGCVLRRVSVEKYCARRPFVTVLDEKGNYSCNFVGKEHVLRGMYGPQLAWWFTLLLPSQFKIINSEDYFKVMCTELHRFQCGFCLQRPLDVLQEIGNFLGLHPNFSQEMLKTKKSNVGIYREESPREILLAKQVLREFYRRPNLELYRLLRQAGHTNFTPFEKELQSMETLNCSDPEIAQSGICGDPRFLEISKEEVPDDVSLPFKVSQVLHIAENGKSREDGAAAMEKESDTVATPASEEPSAETAQPKELEASGSPGTHEEKPGDNGQPEKEKEETEVKAETKPLAPLETAGRGPATHGKKGEGVAAEAEEVPAESYKPAKEASVASRSALPTQMTSPEGMSRKQLRGHKGVLSAERFIHILLAVFLSLMVLYGYPWVTRQQRR